MHANTIAKRRLLVTGAVAVTAAIVLAGCGTSGNGRTTEATGSAVTTTGPAESAADHNQADVTFAQQMIRHHSQAIEMSEMVLVKQDIDPRVTELAQQIKAAQGPEIEQLQSRLAAWGQPTTSSGAGMPTTGPSMPMASPGTSMPGHGMPMTSMPMASPGTGMPGNTGGMNGMMSPEDMAALSNAQGIDASRIFLEQMIEHHSGAIEMARVEIEAGSNPEAVLMAHAIADTQQREITTMQNILSTL